MKRKIVSAVLAMAVFSGTAYAEQPKATEYRNIISSGTYYLEYSTAYGKQTLAVQGDQRMSYTVQVKGGGGALGFVPIVGGVFSMFGSKESKMPNALYQDGKYYHFLSKKEALVANENTLEDPNLDPEEGWASIKTDLTFPAAFTVFAPKEAMNSVVDDQVPEFVESGTETIKGKAMLYDKYAKQEKSATGEVLSETIYYAYYNNKGDLVSIKTAFKPMGGEEEDVHFGEIKVSKITGELPDKAISIPKGCKIYAAGTGDMNDLLDQHVLVEEYKG